MEKCSRTVELALTFDVVRQDDEEYPWVVTLRALTPRGDGQAHDGKCRSCDESTLGSAWYCDGCAVELSVREVGEEDWLATTDPPHVFNPPDESPSESSALVIDREGTIQVRGYMEWTYYAGVDGDEWEETFHVLESRYTMR
ncbi:MAG: hypothetical protein GYA36_19255 [Veillonellaceae bacterium]|nr:hypothetical protein [Veillonellaceae bacterium]